MPKATGQNYDDVLSFVSPDAVAKCREDLERGISTPAHQHGKLVWVNPDRTITDSPKTIPLGDPEE